MTICPDDKKRPRGWKNDIGGVETVELNQSPQSSKAMVGLVCCRMTCLKLQNLSSPDGSRVAGHCMLCIVSANSATKPFVIIQI